MRTFFLVLHILLGLFSALILARGRGPTVDLYAKSAKIVSFNTTLQRDLVLYIKTTRDNPTGIVYFSVYQNVPIKRIFWDISLFYRYGTIYRSYLFSYKRVEACELFKDVKDQNPDYNNPLTHLFRVGVTYCCKKFISGCPFPAGWYNFSVDVNKTAAAVFPPIVPAGYYKVISRIYYEDNSTLNDLQGTCYIKPNHQNRAGDFSMLNMG